MILRLAAAADLISGFRKLRKYSAVSYFMCDVYVFVIICSTYDIYQVQESDTGTYTIFTAIQLSKGKDASHSTRFQPHHTSFPTSSIGRQPQPHQVPLHLTGKNKRVPATTTKPSGVKVTSLGRYMISALQCRLKSRDLTTVIKRSPASISISRPIIPSSSSAQIETVPILFLLLLSPSSHTYNLHNKSSCSTGPNNSKKRPRPSDPSQKPPP